MLSAVYFPPILLHSASCTVVCLTVSDGNDDSYAEFEGVGKRIRKFGKEGGYLAAEAAAAMGITREWYYDVENHVDEFVDHLSLIQVMRLVALLKIDAAELSFADAYADRSQVSGQRHIHRLRLN